MGPVATADFQIKLAAATPAAHDQDHVPIVVWGDPRTPDRSDAIMGKGPSPWPRLKRAAMHLVTSGAGAIVIPCNTAHHWADDIAKLVEPLPLIHIVDAIASEARSRGAKRIGILGTAGTVASGVYLKRLAAGGFENLLPEGAAQQRVQEAIWAVKAGKVEEATASLRAEVQALLDRGADAVALACTEVPVALAHEPQDKLIDATAALARACVAWWRGEGQA